MSTAWYNFRRFRKLLTKHLVYCIQVFCIYAYMRGCRAHYPTRVTTAAWRVVPPPLTQPGQAVAMALTRRYAEEWTKGAAHVAPDV